MLGKRDLAPALQSASDALYLYLLQAGYIKSTLNSDTQTVVVVISVTCPRLMRISYGKSILGGPWGPKAVTYFCLMGKTAPDCKDRFRVV